MNEQQFEIVRLDSEHLAAARGLFAQIAADPTAEFFHPHPFSPVVAEDIANQMGADEYILLLVDGKPEGYGILRGWDEGYDIPSLGIYVTPAMRGTPAARFLMNSLHDLAASHGAETIRLKVHPNNQAAFRLYSKFGYVFDRDDNGQLIGFLDLNR